MTTFDVETAVPQPFAYLKRTSKIVDMPKTMGEGFATLAGLLAAAKTAPAGMPLAHYLDYDEDSTTFDLGFPIRAEDAGAARAAGLEVGETASGRVMKGTHMGPYETANETYQAMMAEMKSKGLTAARDMWEIYFSPPETPKDQIRTDVVWPVS